MTTRHLPDVPKPSEKLKALVTTKVINDIAALVAQATIDRSHQCPYVAGVTNDNKRVLISSDVPDILNDGEDDFHTDAAIPWHELGEKYFMEKLGLDYDDAHNLVTWMVEQPVVTQIMRLNFEGYQHAWDPYVRADEHEKLTNVDPQMFMEPYLDDASSELLASIRRAQGETDAEKAATTDQTLYINRPLLNSEELATWAKAQGFGTTLQPDDMHVTIAFSKQPVDWSKLSAEQNNLTVPPSSDRSLEALGIEKDAIVLIFNCPALTERWQQCKDIGCSWDWPSYRSHVTITWNGKGVDLDKVTPYSGVLEFGPEEFEPVKENWKDNVKESLAKGYSDPEGVLTVEFRGDDGNQLEGLLTAIDKVSSVGHSFPVVVDPGDKDHEQKFSFDGDGAFRILSIDSKDLKKQDTVNTGTNLVWHDQTSASRGGDINWNQEEDDEDLLPEDDEDVLATIAELKTVHSQSK